MTRPDPLEGLAHGDVFEHRGDRSRTVTVLEVDADREQVHVSRNTSRRRQPISYATLRKEYRRRAR